MNVVTLLGRLVRDPDIRTYGEMADKKMARFTIACDRRGKKEEGQQTADFIGCICYGRTAEFVDQYLRQGTKIAVIGEVRTGSYEDKEGKRVYTTDILVNNIEFAESKRSSASGTTTPPAAAAQKPDESWMQIPEGAETSLPWD